MRPGQLGHAALGPGPRYGWCDCCGAPLPDARWTPDFDARPWDLVAHYVPCVRCHLDVYVGHFQPEEED